MQLALALLAVVALSVDANLLDVLGRRRRSIAFDCNGKQDGDYADPSSQCTPNFYKCSAIGVTMQTCPANSVYDPRLKVCNWISGVPECQGTLPPPPAPTPGSIVLPQSGGGQLSFSCSQNPMTSVASAPNFDCYQIPNLRASLLAFDCLQRPGSQNAVDNIPYDCYQKTITGSNAVPTPIVCKTGSGSFSCAGNSGQPIFSCNSKGSSTDNSQPQAYTCSQQVSALPSLSSTQSIAATTQRSPALKMDCAGREGNFPVGPCESSFWQCANGIAFLQPCALSSQRYNPVTNQCVEPMNVPGCSQTRRRRQATNALSCDGKPNGDFPIGLCQNTFFSCSPLGLTLRNCATGTAYDSQAKLCQWTSSLAECSNVVSSSVVPIQPIATTMMPTIATPLPTLSVQQDMSTFTCNGKATGDYINPDLACSPFFYKCTSLGATKVQCPADLMFDPTLRICNRRAAIAACQ